MLEQTNLLRKFCNYIPVKIYSASPCSQCYKTFFVGIPTIKNFDKNLEGSKKLVGCFSEPFLA